MSCQKSVSPGNRTARAARSLAALILILGVSLVAVRGPVQNAALAAGDAAKLAFTASPAAATAGAAFAAQPIVTVQDAAGNTVTSSNVTVTLSITPGTGTSGAILSGTATINAVNGVATFSGLNINRAGTGYTLTAASAGLASATGTAFNVSPGPASRLAFTSSPAGAAAGSVFITQPVVAVQDASGNPITSSSVQIALAITPNTGTSNAFLSGTTTVSAAGGVATFSGLSVNLGGSGYTLTATSAGLTSAASESFNVAAAAAKLTFTTSPAGGTAGTAFPTQPVVAVQDVNGNTVVTSSAAVTVAITSGRGTSGAALSGTATVNAVNGVATFSGLSINLAGSGYTLTATSGNLMPLTSNTFTVSPSAATRLAFITSPGGAIAGSAFVSQPVVAVQDTSGNTVTSSSNMTITLSLTPGTGTSGATLTGTTTLSAISGVATFSGMSINIAGSAYTLTATSAGLTAATSNSFYVAGSAAKLAFITSPAGATAGAAFVTQPVLSIQDASGNTVTTATAPITLAITSGTGATGAILAGTTTMNAVNGVATFGGLSINLAGSGYTLMAISGSLIPATSNSFGVAGTATRLAFIASPPGAVTGSAFATQPAVAVQDASGNTVTTSTAGITVTINYGTGTGGATLSGMTTLNAVNGVAAFSGISINLGGSGYNLSATSTGLTSAISGSFNVSDAASRLAFTTSPVGGIAGAPFTTQPVLTVQDASGNIVTASSTPISLAITPGTGTVGAVLSGTATLNAVNGVAAFSGLSINLPGSGYTLTATGSGLLPAISTGFYVAATSGQQPSATTLSSSVNPSNYGQTVTFTAYVSATVGTPTGTVTFIDGSTTLGAAALGSGQASYATSSLYTGSHTIRATYNSDTGAFITSTGILTQTVSYTTNQASTTSVTSSVNPSSYGQSVTFYAYVTGTTGTPIGTVTFMDSSTTLGYGTLSSGQASYTTSSLNAGSHAISAVYNSDTGVFVTSTGALTQTVSQVTSQVSATTLTSSVNPSYSGQSVTFAVAVSSGTGAPTGSVTFMDGNNVLGYGTLTGSRATYTTSGLTTGSHTIAAVYNSDTGAFITSSASLAQTVNASPIPTITAPPRPAAFALSNLAITPSQVDIGKQVTIGVTVTNTGDVSGSYTVNLKINNTVVSANPVTVAAGAKQTLSFTSTENAAGTYAVALDNLNGSFTVNTAATAAPAATLTAPAAPRSPVPTPAPAPSKQVNWWLVGGVVAGVVVVAFVVWRLTARPKRWWD